MATTKAYVRANNTATIVCPKCGTAKTISTQQIKNRRHKFKIRCRCQHVFDVLIDFRRHYRKSISLTGNYLILRNGQGGGVMHICNISLSGIGFTVSGLHPLRKNQLIGVDFQLNDKKLTVVKKKALVVNVVNNQIGCQFETGVATEKGLGFFLQS